MQSFTVVKDYYCILTNVFKYHSSGKPEYVGKGKGRLHYLVKAVGVCVCLCECVFVCGCLSV